MTKILRNEQHFGKLTMEIVKANEFAKIVKIHEY